MKEAIRRKIREHPLIPMVLDLVSSKGEQIFLVGGAIRDLALEIPPRDLDFATPHPYQTAQFFSERYNSPVVPLGKDATPTYRIPLSKVLLDIVGVQGGTINNDLMLRDFTINSIAYDPESNDFLDPVGGFTDLSDGVIRMAYSKAFTDDPLRMLKAYRMYSQLPSFKLDTTTAKAISNNKNKIKDTAVERIHSELERLFQGKRPGEACRRMSESGLLFVIFPELSELKDLTQNDYHHTDVLNHSLEALEVLDNYPECLTDTGIDNLSTRELYMLRLALLLHDLGKSDTRSVGEDGRIHFFGHSKFSADKARNRLHQLKFPKADSADVYELTLNHLRPIALVNTNPREKAVRRLIHSMGDNLQSLLALSYADKLASKGIEHAENLEALKKLIDQILQTFRSEGETIRSLPKLIDGLRAMEILQMERPGPYLGKALDYLMDKQVEGSVKTIAEAEKCLRNWGRNKI